MTRVGQVLRDREIRNYVKWRCQSNPAALVSVVAEWSRALNGWRKARRPGRTTLEWTLGDAPAIQVHPERLLPHPADAPAVAAAARSRLPDAVARIVADAESILEGHIRLNSGATFELAQMRAAPPGDLDPEHADSFERQYHGLTLAKAWIYTGRAEFIEHYRALLEQWISTHAPSLADPAWGSYTVSERIVSWMSAMPLLWDAAGFRERILVVLTNQLALHARWLADHLEMAGGHNHLINNARALFLYGTGLGDEAAAGIGWEILEQQLFRQVLPDGLLGEQSTHYHFLLTRTYVEVCAARRRTDHPIPPAVVDRVQKMVTAARALLRADGSAPLVGDSSPDIDFASLAGMVPAWEDTFGMSTPGAELSEPSLWLLGSERARRLVNRREEETTSTSLPDAGYAIRKTSRQHIVFHADPRGMVIRHGHADLLSVAVWMQGDEVLSDAGNFSYRPDDWLTYFRGPAAHNVAALDGLTPVVFEWVHQQFLSAGYRKAEGMISPPRTVSGWWSTSGFHTGFDRHIPRSRVARRLIACDDYVWITDWLVAPGEHAFSIPWQFGSLGRQSESGPCVLVNPSGRAVAALEWRRDGRTESPRWVAGQKTPAAAGWHSHRYGSMTPALTGVVEGSFQDRARLDLLIASMPAPTVRLLELDAPSRPAAIASDGWRDEISFDESLSTLMTARRQDLTPPAPISPGRDR